MKKSHHKPSGLIWVRGFAAFYFSIVAYMTLWNTLRHILFFPLLFFTFYYILHKIGESTFSLIPCEENPDISNQSCFLITFLIIFFGQLLYWFAYYPGGFNLDAYGQWDQVHGLMELTNWHPVFTTACYWVLTRICDSFAFCILVQLLLFSLSAAYLIQTLYRLKISKVLLFLSAVYISLCPAISMNNVCLFKDVPFTITLIWATIILINIIQSKGDWIKSSAHMAGLVANLLILSLIRHNGIFITVPLLICLLLIYRQFFRKILSAFLAYVLLFASIEGLLFPALSIEKHSNFTGESVGIPMAMMANSLISDNENTPIEVKEFLLSVADQSDWEKYYELGEWDSCKWEFGGAELFQEESLEKFFELSLLSLQASPETAYQSLRENTRVVWQIVGFADWDTWIYIEDNDYGIQAHPNKICAGIVESILKISMTFIGTIFSWNIGLPNAVMIFLIWFTVLRRDYQNLLLMVPLVCYNLLTMLLLVNLTLLLKAMPKTWFKEIAFPLRI